MVEYLSFNEVASALKCSISKVRQLVVEDKSLQAKRITPNGMVLQPSGADTPFTYDLGFDCHVSDEGQITSDIYESGPTGAPALTRTLDVGWLRIERSDLDAFIKEDSYAKKQRADLADDSSAHWPWGEHNTKLLEHLEAAASEFWVKYDPQNQKDTAPKRDEVIAWLQARKVSTQMATAIATILRPDDLPSGPRK
jgi:hypothetical protein